MKRIAAVASVLFLLVAAKAPPPVASVTVTTVSPVIGQAVTYTYVTGTLKGYEYPIFDTYCDFDGDIRFGPTSFPTLTPGDPLVLPADPRAVPTYPVLCTVEMFAYGGNRSHPTFGRLLADSDFLAGQ